MLLIPEIYGKKPKSLIGWTNYGGPKMLIVDNQPITSPKKMAAELNKDYVLRTAKAARNTTPPKEDPMISYYKMIGDRKLNMAFQPVTKLQLMTAFNTINPSKSAANDEISIKLLKKIKDPLVPIFQHLVNMTIISSHYPTPLKFTKIVPLLKKDQTVMKSYRGVN